MIRAHSSVADARFGSDFPQFTRPKRKRPGNRGTALRSCLSDAVACDFAKLVEPFDIIKGAQPPLRPLHLVVRETEFCGQRLAGDFSRRMREKGRNSVRRPRHVSLTDRNYGGFCLPGNRVGLPVLYGGGCRN